VTEALRAAAATLFESVRIGEVHPDAGAAQALVGGWSGSETEGSTGGVGSASVTNHYRYEFHSDGRFVVRHKSAVVSDVEGLSGSLFDEEADGGRYLVLGGYLALTADSGGCVTQPYRLVGERLQLGNVLFTRVA